MAPFTRVLFLDFDGVLHRAGGPPGYTVPFKWVPQLVEDLTLYPDVGICVHSSWAHTHELEYIREFIAPLDDRLVGIVERGPKAPSVLVFLQAHPEIRGWLVLDDDETEFGVTFEGAVLVCDPSEGVAGTEVRRRLRGWLSSGMLPSRSARGEHG